MRDFDEGMEVSEVALPSSLRIVIDSEEAVGSKAGHLPTKRPSIPGSKAAAVSGNGKCTTWFTSLS